MNDLSWAATVRFVHERAQHYCEYCKTSQKVMGQTMHVEHINPSGDDHPENLCLSCSICKLNKAKVTSATDPQTGGVVALFNPRKQYWTTHFEWTDGGERLLGKTPNGRATIERLGMNRERVVIARRVWIRAGDHPPTFE